MNPEVEQWLRDALAAAELIVRATRDQTLEGYLADTWFQSPTGRQLEIVGEAPKHVRRQEPALVDRFPKIHEWVALRNVISHIYDRVDLQIVWDTVRDEVPELVGTVRELLTEGHGEADQALTPTNR